MVKHNDLDEMFEFRIQFHHKGSDFINDRHFTAVSYQSAIEMFEFACRKEELDVEVVQVEKWNRWADRWEVAEEVLEKEVDLAS
jgi:exo-beta-1,3-glucanase (GH17 family)